MSVDTEEELLDWQKRLEAKGVGVSQSVRHEILESIYFRDPNHYPLEITRRLRDIERPDATDAELTINAALELEASGHWTNIEQLWRTKARYVSNYRTPSQRMLRHEWFLSSGRTGICAPRRRRPAHRQMPRGKKDRLLSLHRFR